jgi:hypothetical protein
MLNYIIQARITVAHKVVAYCKRCKVREGRILFINYEVVTPQIFEQMQKDMNRGAGQLIYDATLHEQENGLPQEHMHHYYCPFCLSSFLNHATGMQKSGPLLTIDLMDNPSQHAIWITHDISTKYTQVLATSVQNVEEFIALLKGDPFLHNVELRICVLPEKE